MKRVIGTGLVFLFALLSGVAAQETTKKYNGDWWRSVPKEERTGFLAGYTDCAVYDAGQKQLAEISWNVLEPKVTDYYNGHASELRTPAATLFVKLSPLQHTQTESDKGESFPGKHGIFDGEYWRLALPDHRLGFLEGYLECQRQNNKPVANFSHPAVWYADQISQWYGVKADDPGEINPKRTDKKIADVLYFFRTKPAKVTSQPAVAQKP
ncbi:MAG: hypothetical protein ABR912_16935 [Terracidiphilus sp.]|jgi:hypothetical protein